MGYLKIANWDKWQTYRKDRGQPPWIKIHRRLLRNPEWVSLTDAERGQLVVIWLLAADHDGVIPASPEIIQKLCFMSKIPNINKFIGLGFIEDDGRQHGVTVASNGCQHDQPKAEERRGEEIYGQSFLQFWVKYPIKKAKAKAFEVWKKIKPPKINIIITAIDQQMKEKEYLKSSNQFCPEWKHPATWLRQKCWEDEIIKIEDGPRVKSVEQVVKERGF